MKNRSSWTTPILIALTLVSSSLSAASQAYDYKVATAKTTGSYHKVGGNLTQMISGGIRVPSKGSRHNMQMLDKGEVDLAIVQSSEYVFYKRTNADSDTQFIPLGNLYKECFHLAIRKGAKVTDEDHLQQSGVTVAIGAEGSGTNSAWDLVRALEKGYQKAAVAPLSGSLAFAQLANAQKRGENPVDAVLWVTRPSVTDRMTMFVAESDEFKIVSFDDRNLKGNIPELNRPVFTPMKIVTKKGLMSDTKVSTMCEDAIIVGVRNGREGNGEFLGKVASVVLMDKPTLLKGLSK